MLQKLKNNNHQNTILAMDRINKEKSQQMRSAESSDDNEMGEMKAKFAKLLQNFDKDRSG